MQKLLVCDLDNTLYDWAEYFVSSFYPMVDETVRVTGVDKETLLNDFRHVHQRHKDSEHPFALLETRSVLNLYPNKSRSEIAVELDPAFHTFNLQRKRTLKLYEGVEETLDRIVSSGVTVVAHTEGKLFSVMDRFTRLGLTRFFSRIYCRERSSIGHHDPRRGEELISKFPMDIVTELSHHQRKPSPSVLAEICKSEGIDPSQTAYVGDSLSRDIYMAKEAHVKAIWAKYGATDMRRNFEALVRISHWTEEDVVRERQLKEQSSGVLPDATLERSFAELLSVL